MKRDQGRLKCFCFFRRRQFRCNHNVYCLGTIESMTSAEFHDNFPHEKPRVQEKKEQDDVIASDNWETSELKTLKEAVTTSVSASDSKVDEVETMQQQEKLVEVEEV